MSRKYATLASLCCAVFACGGAEAAVIAGPALTTIGGTYVSGLEFKALKDATLNSFTFQNRGLADTIDLIEYNSALNTYNVVGFVNTVGGNMHQTLDVNWTLTSGDSYFLVQFARNNAELTKYGLALPSDGDISLIRSSVFGRGLAPALIDSSTPNAYWADFNNITTTSLTASAVPELATWALFAIGVGLTGASLRLRAAKPA